MTSFLTCPQDVRSADLGQAVVIVDARTGRVETLLGSGRSLWLALSRTGSFHDPALEADIDVTQADQLTGRLLADGLLTATAVARPWDVPRLPVTTPSWGTKEVPAGLAPTTSLSRCYLLLAAAALVVVLLMRHAGSRRRSFARMLTLLRASTRRRRRVATRQAVDRVLQCVRQVAYALPFRIACLEETIAAMLVLAVTGQSAVWCHGVATDPIRLHAWLTADGVPVGEPASTASYTPLFHVPETGRVRGGKETG